jgi:HME family heavy-metal exporter
VTIFGGLVSSTLLDTLLTPVLFLRFGEAPLARILAARAKAVAAASPALAEAY